MGAKAFGREFELLGRNKDTTKEEFKAFIKKHINEGYPCIALGIIGPPEACLITGYREQGEILLGWNFFQNDPDFAANVKKEENGYFHCDSWWENTDTQAVMSIGPIEGQKITTEEILKNAVQIMTGRKEYSYCKGLFAYDAWLAMLKDQRNFSVSAKDYSSVLFEKLLCQTDAMSCLSDGRGSAADYFMQLSQQKKEKAEIYKQVAESFLKTKQIALEMQQLIGGWEDMEQMLHNFADEKIRKRVCNCIEEVKLSEKKSLDLIKQSINFK